ncbi:retrotransposon protein, putative, ty1-copia subclass [Tanacetum coccineum]
MLAIAAFHDYEICQMDVKTAFLNGKLTEDVFMAQPEGFENPKYPKRVCKLQKAIHGLKQASHSWNLCFHEKVTQFRFSRSEDESCIYVKTVGVLSKRLIGLSQDTYLDKILKRFKIDNSKKRNLPLHHDIKISSESYSKTNDELDKMSRNPGECHWTAVKNILRYLRNTKDMFLVYGGEKELRVTGYCDGCSKQDIVADSTCESKYIAACEASKEAIWMNNFIGDLGVVPTVQDPIQIFCDTESAVALTKEPKDHGKSKHIERKYHFVRSKVEEGHEGVISVKAVGGDTHLGGEDFDKAMVIHCVQEFKKRQKKDISNGVSFRAKSINADEAVAYGAAVLAANLSVDKKMSVLIPRNTPTPTTKEDVFHTTIDNQVSMPIRVFQGESSQTKDNIFLDEFNLYGVPPAPAGDQKVKVCFSINTNCILNVSAELESTGTKKSIVIAGSGKLSQDDIEKMLKKVQL